MASRSSPHVLIAGAGLGGLTLAQALRKQGISCEVFERDHEGTSRPQGAAISLHSMLDDLRSSTPDDLPPLETVDHLLPLDLATDFAIFTAGQPGKIGVRDDGSHRFIRANRARLRAWLATKVSVRYGKRAVRFAEEEKRVTVYFEDGTSATGDILVGADGANSALRKHLLQGPDPLRREPVGVVGGEVTVRGAALAQQLSLAHSAYVVESGPADAAAAPWRYFVGLKDVAPDGASARYYFYVMWPDAEAAAAGAGGGHWTQTADGRQMLDFARDRVGRLGDPVFGVLPDLAGPGDMMVPPLHFSTLLLDALPAGRVTLLGDAAHAMTPFRGEGGCHAMQDALNLARALARIDFDDDANIRQVLGEYQKEMLKRGAHAAALSSEAFPYQTMTQSIMLWGEKLEPLDEEKVICSEIPRVSDEVYARLQSV